MNALTTGARDVSPPDVAALFDAYSERVHRYCAHRVGPVAAEDLVAEVFLVAHRHRDRIAGPGEPLAWLYGIATNLLRRHRRDEVRAYRALARVGVDPFGGATGVVDSHDSRSAERVDATRTGRRLAGALAALPRRQRDVLLLFAIAELSYAEIAVALDIPIGSVRSALSRARASVRAAIDLPSDPDASTDDGSTP
ncbi:RNA polymerase sigma factor [Dactylosporangium sp. NPDC050588]|uniref:RNA polymerase sigma factor n=1 Tax=Dactylosporangium sp. NPDC050588 TaxID=3157211 RepID=UPI0033C11F10